MEIRLKRAFDEPSADDGYRVLVDRLWPRGKTREALKIDAWLRDAAPSTGLRRWYGHDVSRWPDFRARYEAELANRADVLGELRKRARAGVVTLVFAAGDTEHSNAAVLKQALEAGG
jgi:uncharacterized protein YeaO (DUF488 family)